MAKPQPAPLTVHLRLPGSQQAGYADLGQILSILNRRAMRQGYQYAVSNLSVQYFISPNAN